MTLHDQVRNPRSSVRHVLGCHARELDHWRDLIADRCSTEPIRPDRDDVPWSPIGHAVSALLCWQLGGNVPDVATAVADRCGAAARDLLATITAQRPDTFDASTQARLAWWVGQIDRLARHRRPDDPDLVALASADSVDEALAVAPGAWVDDVGRVAAANCDIVASIAAGPRPLMAAPTFAGSRLVGAAEADLIAGGSLIEIKTTLSRRPPLRDVHQMLAYALLDFDDQYELRHLGYWSTRHATLVTVPVTDVIDDVEAARTAMHTTLRDDAGFDHEVADQLRELGEDPRDVAGLPPAGHEPH